MSTALVTGVAGQDGVYLARLLLGEGTRVIGTVRPGSGSTVRMAPYLEGVTLVEHDVRDAAGFERLLAEHDPDEVYNLAGLTSVAASWQQPELAAETNATAVEGMLKAVAGSGARFFQASSGEQLGTAAHSPYAEAKQAAHDAVVRSRDAGVFACAGVLFSHESPLRGEQFVTRKISRTVAAIATGRATELRLGDLDVRRDWGSAAEYVEAMPLMLRRDEPADFTIATGVTRSLREVVDTAFEAAGLDGAGQYVVRDPALTRHVDAKVLVGDVSAARDGLGWAARTHADTVMAEMVAVDLRRLESGVEESLAYLFRDL